MHAHNLNLHHLGDGDCITVAHLANGKIWGCLQMITHLDKRSAVDVYASQHADKPKVATGVVSLSEAVTMIKSMSQIAHV